MDEDESYVNNIAVNISHGTEHGDALDIVKHVEMQERIGTRCTSYYKIQVTAKMNNVNWLGIEFTQNNVFLYDAIVVYESYLTFTALENGTFSFTGNDVMYSTDGGRGWSLLSSGQSTAPVAAREKIMWKAELTPNSTIGIGTFSSTGRFTAEGNPLSMIYGDDFVSNTDISQKSWAFYRLFESCATLTDASGMTLSATELSQNCYRNMFANCTRLTSAPNLPAKSLTRNCYQEMFSGCTGLTQAPDLPALNLE